MMLRRYHEGALEAPPEVKPVEPEAATDEVGEDAEDQPKRRGRKPKVAEE